MHRSTLRFISMMAAAFAAVTLAVKAGGWLGADVGRWVGAFALTGDGFVALNAPWTLLTYSLIHVDLLHLAANAAWMAVFGTVLARTAGWRFAAAVFAAGVLAGALTFIYMCGADEWLIGASAGILAMAAAALVVMPHRVWRTPRVALPTVAAAVLLVATMWFAMPAAGEATVAVHAAGAMAGAVAGAVMLALRRSPSAATAPASAIVDKINSSGYGSLDPDERDRLFDLSAHNPMTCSDDGKEN